jgi:predicted ATP-grasp superfamily ATP-dependent carboligase
MELVYGAIDFRRDERDGRFRFLEINPAGQWLFVEQQTGQPIAAAIADELAALAATAIPARLDEPAAAH